MLVWLLAQLSVMQLLILSFCCVFILLACTDCLVLHLVLYMNMSYSLCWHYNVHDFSDALLFIIAHESISVKTHWFSLEFQFATCFLMSFVNTFEHVGIAAATECIYLMTIAYTLGYLILWCNAVKLQAVLTFTHRCNTQVTCNTTIDSKQLAVTNR